MEQFNRVAGISQKYDGTLDYGIEMYDKLPYKRNSDVCNASAVAMVSGHIIKYYLCKNQEEAFEVSNHDEEIEEILHRIRYEEMKRLEEASAGSEVIGMTEETLTDEQLQALTTDQGEASEEGAEAEEENHKEIFNLDEVEDW